MELTIPIYIEVRREEGRLLHHVRPLFFGGPQASDAHLGLAMGKFNKRLKEVLDSLGRENRHEGLAAAAFSPNLQTSLQKLTLDLRQRQVKTKFLFVTFAAFDRRVAFTPSLPELWFEYWHEDKLEERATNVLSRYFREQERAQRKGRLYVTPENVSLAGQAWVSSVDLEVQTKPLDAKKLERALAALFDDARVDGDSELQRVGRCLDWLYPAELQEAVGRDREVTQLTQLLAGSDNRPVVLVGPRLSGKTTVLHECVRRRVIQRGKPYSAKQNVWLLSPQRLISGMMYVGQWEGRLQAILKVAKKRQHVLYFDDFLGLYRAGISRDASLSAAEVIKPFIQRREVRVLAEMTPEAWQAFNERDRGLADQFQVIRVAAMGEEATRRVLLQVQRGLEREHGARFDLAALPAILQLQQSYIRDAAFPGKAAGFARQLAKKHTKASITRREVYQEFHHKTGLSLAILDEHRRLDRDQVLKELQSRMIGQSEAVGAAADVVTVAKARLTDRHHPLATLLFLGPTGVGKTQCAKALAEVMYSDSNRLLRFDMNEYASPSAAAQLLGTPQEPDGLLTSAVRRQPFSVVLLDEIEKAHPDVFDLLLQVTGEGRLTDSLGRTADFTNAVVVMTSNLGTAHSGRQIGLGASDAARQHVFVRAAESFFRPEFFNRLDRVIPFENLSREQMRQIAELLLEDVFKRDGLVRRRCALAVEPAAMERIVDAGYHPQFGARALKRAIEQQLMHPVAASLSGVKPELPAVIGVYPAEEGVSAWVQPLESAAFNDARAFDDATDLEKLRRLDRFLERCETELEATKPSASSTSRGLSPEQIRYYALKEQLHHLRELEQELADAVQRARTPGAQIETSPRQPGSTRGIGRMTTRVVSPKGMFRDIHAARDIHDYLNEAAFGPRPEALAQQFLQVRYEAAYLQALQSATNDPQEALLVIHPLCAPARSSTQRLLDLEKLFVAELGFTCQRVTLPDQYEHLALRLAGPGIWPLASSEAGVHMFCRRQENLLPVQVSVFSISENALPSLDTQHAERSRWMSQRAPGASNTSGDPWPIGSVVRFYDEAGPTADVRSGLSLPTFPTPKEWRTLLLAGLPLPPELLVASAARSTDSSRGEP